MSLSDNYIKVSKETDADKVTLVAVSKTHPVEKIKELYDAGCRDFGENKVQELESKASVLPKDIKWHLIGHLQTNKTKYIAGFVHLIHSVDSLKLLAEINRQATKHDRVIHCLLEMYIADEETKFGLSEAEVLDLLNDPAYKQMSHVKIAGLMGMASNTHNKVQVHREFRNLKVFFDRLKHDIFQNAPDFYILSMGMSGDYKIAMEEGSTMVRVGSAIFGDREYPQ